MSLWSRIFALAYDPFLARAERLGIAQARANLLAQARGRILEIGAGTGLNVAHYPPGADVVLTEPDPHMARRARRRGGEVIEASADALPFPDASFDTVVSTLVLCGVDQERSLGEVRRVLRPGGRLFFLEHVRSDDPGLARLQDRMNPLNRFLVGCECNRETLAAIEAAGFTISRVERATMPEAPKFVRPAILGTAVAAG